MDPNRYPPTNPRQVSTLTCLIKCFAAAGAAIGTLSDRRAGEATRLPNTRPRKVDLSTSEGRVILLMQAIEPSNHTTDHPGCKTQIREPGQRSTPGRTSNLLDARHTAGTEGARGQTMTRDGESHGDHSADPGSHKACRPQPLKHARLSNRTSLGALPLASDVTSANTAADGWSPQSPAYWPPPRQPSP